MENPLFAAVPRKDIAGWGQEDLQGGPKVTESEYHGRNQGITTMPTCLEYQTGTESNLGYVR